MLRSVLLSLALATFAHAQNPPGYNTVFYAAKERGVPLVVFVGCEGREIAGVETLECSRFPDAPTPQIVVGDPDTLRCQRLAPTATDSEIRAAFPVKAKPIREYVSSGKVYREYYSAPQTSTPVYASPTTYYGSCANGQCSPQAAFPGTYTGYSSAPVYYGGGFASGPVSGGFYAGAAYYGGSCQGGNCPPR